MNEDIFACNFNVNEKFAYGETAWSETGLV